VAQPGKTKNQEMETTGMVHLNFCSELDDLWPGWHASLVLTGDN